MSNEGFFQLGLTDVSGRPVNESKVKVGFIRIADNKTILSEANHTFPPPHRFSLPAFPQEKNLFCEVTTPRYRSRRSGAAPDVPTIAESGLPGFDVPGWYAIFVPAKTPGEIVAKMNADVNAAIADATVKGRLEDLGLFVGGSTPEALGAYVKTETDTWGPVIKAAGISIKE